MEEPQGTPVLTVTGKCGTTVVLPVLGTRIAFKCEHSNSQADDPDPATPATELHDPGGPAPFVPPSGELTHVLSSGSGGGWAAVHEIGDRARAGVRDEHLLVIDPDGTVSADPSAYSIFVDSYAPQARQESVSLEIHASLQSVLSHPIDADAQPYVIVCSPQVGQIGADQLSATLHKAAESNAPVHLFTM